MLGGTGGGFVVGDLEQRNGRLFLARQGLGHAPFNGLETRFDSGQNATFETIGQGIGQRIHTVDATHADTLLRRIARYKGKDIFTPDRLATQVRSQVHHWAVATGSGDQIALEPFARAGDAVGLDVDRSDTGRGHVLAATGLDHSA
ncbi:hypothetical protein D9M71_303730 [compost metagenome]